MHIYIFHYLIYEQPTKLFVKYNAMHKLGSSPSGCEEVQYSRRYHKRGVGIGSSPIGLEGFVQAQKGQGEARQILYQNNFVAYSYVCSNLFVCIIHLYCNMIWACPQMGDGPHFMAFQKAIFTLIAEMTRLGPSMPVAVHHAIFTSIL